MEQFGYLSEPLDPRRFPLPDDVFQVRVSLVGVDTALEMRRKGIAQLVRSLANALPEQLSPSDAIAILDALTLRSIYKELVVVHRWTADHYEAWLARALRREMTEAARPTR